MNQGPVRTLPVLGISESSMNQKEATRLKDVDCLDVIPMVKTTGADIVARYESVFERTGYPSAFLQDGGSNLNSAADLLNEKRSANNLPLIPKIPDIGHFSATVVKKKFNKEAYLVKFLDQATSFNLKVRVTKYSFLMAPKARTAGRYMGHMKQMVRWLYRLKTFTREAGRPTDGSLGQFVLEAFPDLCKTIRELTELVEVIDAEEFILKKLKIGGLTQGTYRSTKNRLKSLPEGHFYREAMLTWLENCWTIRKSIGITGALRVSSDIIETANGHWKQITARMAGNETTHLALAFPTFFGDLTEEQIANLIANTSLNEVKDWCEDRVPITQSKLKKMKFKPDTQLSEIDELFANSTQEVESKAA